MEHYEEENFSPENEHITERENVQPTPEPEAYVRQAPPEPGQMPAGLWQEPGAYRSSAGGRKESPYANSPYVMNRPQQNPYWHQPQPDSGRGGYQPNSGSADHRYQSCVNSSQYQPQYQAPQKPKEKKHKTGFWKKAVALAAALALVAGSCAITASLVNDRWEDRTARMEESFTRQIQDLQSQIDSAAEAANNSMTSAVITPDGVMNVSTAGQVYANNVQSVVLIESTITSTIYGQSATGTSAGSGFILTQDGYVVTNYHVIEGASAVKVSMVDGSKYPAEVVGYDDTNDVAVLKIEASGLDAVTLGSSTDLIVGDQVVAIGNPLGELTSTLTVGYVSAKERDVSTDGTVINMLQTDCAINSGNSGGPLFNMKGEVVGITTAKYSGSSSSGASIEGIGFAIPIDDVIGSIGELMEYGYIKSAYMGVIVQNMDGQTASIYGLPIGAYVAEVEEGGPAQLAGIQAKDIIIAVGDTTVEGITDLTRALREYEPGDIAKVTIYRGGAELVLDVELVERPRDTQTVIENYQNPQEPQEPQMPEGNYEDWFDYFAPFFGYGGNNGG